MVAGLSGAGGRKNSGVQRGISPQLALTVLNVRQQVTQEHPNSWGLLWGPGSIESKHRDAGADLFQGQQGILKNLVGGNGGSEGVNRSDGDCSQYSHRHPPVTMQDPHNGQNPVQQARMSGSDQFPSGTPDHHRWCRKGKRVEIWRCPHPNPFLELMTSKVSFPKLQERHMDGVAQELDVVEDWDNPTTNQEYCQN